MEEEKVRMTESLNEMIDSKGIDNIQLAASIIKNQPDLLEKGILKGHWYNIEDIVSKQCKKYVELYYSDSKSDKIYIIAMEPCSSGWRGTYDVIGYYGRRGKSILSDTKVQNTSIQNAEWYFNHILKDKLKKGYKQINY